MINTIAAFVRAHGFQVKITDSPWVSFGVPLPNGGLKQVDIDLKCWAASSAEHAASLVLKAVRHAGLPFAETTCIVLNADVTTMSGKVLFSFGMGDLR